MDSQLTSLASLQWVDYQYIMHISSFITVTAKMTTAHFQSGEEEDVFLTQSS